MYIEHKPIIFFKRVNTVEILSMKLHGSLLYNYQKIITKYKVKMSLILL